ncbi:MAG: class I SAM-dependent methyltransferase, partial [Mycobacteriaceae bacterium]
DVHGSLTQILREVAEWAGREVLDIGCGTGFHLPMFAVEADSVIGVEPHPPLVELARGRTQDLPSVTVQRGSAQSVPLPDNSVDVAHARTAYFFGPGCEPGLAEASRVLRPGGVLAVLDLDATRSTYGAWMRRDVPGYCPGAVEQFFQQHGFTSRGVDTVWQFENRDDLRAVLGIEFSPAVAARALAATRGLTVDVAYRVRWRRKVLTRA